MDPVTYALTLVPTDYVAPVLAVMAICAMVDAALPQPAAGSVWVIPRKVVSMIGINFGNARNAIKPGSEAATIMPSDVLNAVVVNHAEAQVSRTDLASAIKQVPGKLNDLASHVDTAVQTATQIKQAIESVAGPDKPAP